MPASWRRAGDAPARQVRWVVYALAGGVAAATVGTYLVLVLLGCGLVEVTVSGGVRPPKGLHGFVISPLGVVGRVGWVHWRGWRSRSVRCRSAAGS